MKELESADKLSYQSILRIVNEVKNTYDEALESAKRSDVVHPQVIEKLEMGVKDGECIFDALHERPEDEGVREEAEEYIEQNYDLISGPVFSNPGP
ncbi:MAG: hypothetical protein ACOC2K_03090, partial [Bacteroidota bacterium]